MGVMDAFINNERSTGYGLYEFGGCSLTDSCRTNIYATPSRDSEVTDFYGDGCDDVTYAYYCGGALGLTRSPTKSPTKTPTESGNASVSQSCIFAFMMLTLLLLK